MQNSKKEKLREPMYRQKLTMNLCVLPLPTMYINNNILLTPIVQATKKKFMPKNCGKRLFTMLGVQQNREYFSGTPFYANQYPIVMQISVIAQFLPILAAKFHCALTTVAAC